MGKKVGLLLPRSVLFPSIAFDIRGGFSSYLEQAGVKDMEIVSESSGLGADDKLIYGVCEKLLFDGVTIVAGYVNPTTAEKLNPLFASANAIFITLDAGYHYPSSTKALSNVFTISLQGALCHRIAATSAVAEGGKSFALTGSFYDAGYRGVHAFCRGLEDAGGNLVINHITKLKREDFTLEPLKEFLNEHTADGILAAFSGDMLQDLFAVASADNLFERPVYTGAFAGDEQWLAQCAYPGTDVKTYVTWASVLDNTENARFLSAATGKNIKKNLFSLLGWELGQVVSAVHGCKNTDDMVRILEGMAYAGPRGGVTIDQTTHQTYAPVYEARIVKNVSTGNCALVVIGESPYTQLQREKLENDINSFSGAASSWQNAYGCLDS